MKKRKKTGNRCLLRCLKPSLETGKGKPHGAGKLGRVLAFSAICLLVIACAGQKSFAKQKPAPVKAISGAVLTGTNTGVSGASVILTDLETHVTDAIYSGTNGNYSFPGLNPNHDYRVHATYKQLVSDTREVSSLDSRSRIVINLILHPQGPDSSNAQQ